MKGPCNSGRKHIAVQTKGLFCRYGIIAGVVIPTATGAGTPRVVDGQRENGSLHWATEDLCQSCLPESLVKQPML